MENVKIKNIIFDLGNVLLNYNPEEYLKTKITEADKISEVHNQVFQSDEWALLDRGTLTEREAITVLCNRNANNSELIKLAFDNWYDLLTPIEASVEILKQLKEQHYNVYFLSNFHLHAFEIVTKKYDFFNIFDGGVVSYEEKMIKPEENIYKRILEKYNLKPEESIFIDDVQANVEGAKKLNINTILFKDSNDLRNNLRNYNVNIL